MRLSSKSDSRCSHAWKLVGIGKIGRVYECKHCRLTWTPDEDEGGGRHPEGPLPTDHEGFGHAVLRHMAQRPRCSR